jgi:hypothetical protein
LVADNDEHWQRVFENRVLMRIFGPKRDDVIGKWRKLHDEELNNLYSSPNIVRGDKIENKMGKRGKQATGETQV